MRGLSTKPAPMLLTSGGQEPLRAADADGVAPVAPVRQPEEKTAERWRTIGWGDAQARRTETPAYARGKSAACAYPCTTRPIGCSTAGKPRCSDAEGEGRGSVACRSLLVANPRGVAGANREGAARLAGPVCEVLDHGHPAVLP